jgi:hypothetical protein
VLAVSITGDYKRQKYFEHVCYPFMIYEDRHAQGEKV